MERRGLEGQRKDDHLSGAADGRLWLSHAAPEQVEGGVAGQGALMFDILQLATLMAVAAAILGTALAYAWRDATRDMRGRGPTPEA